MGIGASHTRMQQEDKKYRLTRKREEANKEKIDEITADILMALAAGARTDAEVRHALMEGGM